MSWLCLWDTHREVQRAAGGGVLELRREVQVGDTSQRTDSICRFGTSRSWESWSEDRAQGTLHSGQMAGVTECPSKGEPGEGVF